MAINQVDKALNLATNLIDAADQLMTAVFKLDALKAEKESSGVDFTAAAVEAALAASTSLRHVDGTALNNVITSGAATKTWLEQNFHDDNFQKVRR